MSVGGKIPGEIDHAGDARGRINNTRGGNVEMLDVNLRVERSERRIGRINGAGFALELYRAVAGSFRREFERELRGVGEVGRLEIHVPVRLSLSMRAGGAHDDRAIGNLELRHGEIRGSG